MQKKENNAFYCENCQRKIGALTNGFYRNHYPYCLYSKHVDVFPRDRASTCLGLMEPVDLKKHSKKGYQVVHQCQTCKQL